jgi:hypothetical protein
MSFLMNIEHDAPSTPPDLMYRCSRFCARPSFSVSRSYPSAIKSALNSGRTTEGQ